MARDYELGGDHSDKRNVPSSSDGLARRRKMKMKCQQVAQRLGLAHHDHKSKCALWRSEGGDTFLHLGVGSDFSESRHSG